MMAATSLHETLTQQSREEGGVNPNSGETLCATCQPLIAQSNWSNLVNWSNFGQLLVHIVKMIK